ncbi:phage head closure protein (plasmid) [Skermanella sp. TT6]|uniref:Phage head closure protein n=1 Tax=Skermanella cutis TaxID=2775420 RepID=A0ABX7BII0_9PROT|nr:phage head closure protein [Skermanella sp. TT6]QQP93561.1 phage head closure protein [Skermanella sp. TT6]
MARQIQPGNLSERVLLQAEVHTPDGGGGYTVAWTTVTPLWAEVIAQTGKAGEVVHAEQTQPRDRYRITIRNRRGITVDNRLVWRGLVMNITDAADPGPRSAFRVIEVEYGGPT